MTKRTLHKRKTNMRDEMIKYKKNIKKEIRSVELGVCPMQLFYFWSRDVHPEILRHNDFQNGGRPPSWNCYTTIRDHPRSLCCWPQLPVKFHVNLIHISEDIAIWICRIFGQDAYSGAQNGGFGGLWTTKCDYSSSRPKTAHPCVNPRLLNYQP